MEKLKIQIEENLNELEKGTEITVEFIELTQKKTGKYVLVPMDRKIKTILEKRNGNFPRYLSDVKFNIYLQILSVPKTLLLMLRTEIY